MDDSSPVPSDPTNGAHGPRLLAQISILLFEGEVIRLQTGPLPLDIAERMCFGAMKFLERELIALRVARLLDAPRIVPGDMLPRRLS